MLGKYRYLEHRGWLLRTIISIYLVCDILELAPVFNFYVKNVCSFFKAFIFLLQLGKGPSPFNRDAPVPESSWTS